MTLNRVVAIVSAVISLALAVLPVVGNFDWSSTAGVIAGIVAVLGITDRWLHGWQKWEEQRAAYDPAEHLAERPRRGIVKRRHRLPRPAERPE